MYRRAFRKELPKVPKPWRSCWDQTEHLTNLKVSFERTPNIAFLDTLRFHSAGGADSGGAL